MFLSFRRAAILGAGKSAAAAARLLQRHGYEFSVYPDADSVASVLNAPSLDLLILSPGTDPSFLPPAPRSYHVIPEVELGWLFLPPAVRDSMTAVTGTNGKSTTTALISQIFETSGVSCPALGNIGTPLSAYEGGERVVVEVSSYMLQITEAFRPHVAVFLNLSPDHLARHGTYENYAKTKRRLFLRQDADDFAILNADDPTVRACAPVAQTLRFGIDDPADAFMRGGTLYFRGRKLADANKMRISGKHNLYNALAAAAASIAGGAPVSAVTEALYQFDGIPHRLRLIATKNGVKIYDDSKATNCDSAITAVRALRGKIVIILGGSDKGENFGPLFAEFIKRGGIFAVLSGTTAGRLADAATEAEYKDFIVAETFEDAVERAYTAAIEQSASLLLSPACASFDRFESFEQRGDYFIQLAQLLRGTK